MRRKFGLFLIIFVLTFLFNIKCIAADVRILSINGGDTQDDDSFFYSASMFYTCMEELYVNNIKVKSANCHYYKDPTYSQITNLIESSFSSAKNNDISIFYYSGHGTYTESNGNAGIYTSDGRNYEFTTLYKKLKKISGKKLIVIDCCYSGAFITQNSIDMSKFTVLTACSEDSYSPFYNRISLLSLFNKKQVYMTRFSNSFLTGLGFFDGKMKADNDSNKIVTTDEIYSYLQKKYQKTYWATDNNGKKISFKAIPQKCGNVVFSFSKSSFLSEVAIKLNKSSVSIYKNETKKLNATVTGSYKSVIWKSSNKKVATVNSSGKVTGKRAGTAVITAKVDGKTAKCKVKVKNPSIKLNKSSATIYTSGATTVMLKATVEGASSKIKWKSSNDKIATVNSKGKVSAKKAGTVTITAKANGKTAKCKITVKNKPADYEKLLKKNMTTEQAAKAIGCKFYYTDPAEGITCYRLASKKLLVSCSDGAEKMPGEWKLFTNGKKVSICGIKVGMSMSTARSKLGSAGWRKYRQYGSPSWGYTMVYKKGNFLIYYTYFVKNQVIESIMYSPYTRPLA